MSNTALMFDTLQYAKKLQKAGVPEQQAEIQAEAFKEQNIAINNWIDDNLATKRDLKELETRIVFKLGSMLVGCFGILSVFIVIFHK